MNTKPSPVRTRKEPPVTPAPIPSRTTKNTVAVRRSRNSTAKVRLKNYARKASRLVVHAKYVRSNIHRRLQFKKKLRKQPNKCAQLLEAEKLVQEAEALVTCIETCAHSNTPSNLALLFDTGLFDSVNEGK